MSQLSPLVVLLGATFLSCSSSHGDAPERAGPAKDGNVSDETRKEILAFFATLAAIRRCVKLLGCGAETFYDDPDIGSLLRGERMAAVRERYPPPARTK